VTTFVRAWNLAATLVLLRPWWAGEDVGVAIVIGTFAGAVAYTVLYGGVTVIDRLQQRHGGSTPPASTASTKERSVNTVTCKGCGREIDRDHPEVIVDLGGDESTNRLPHFCNLACFRQASLRRTK